jgi:AcrR family transcriptional regulator
MTGVAFPTAHPPLRFEGAAGDPRARQIVEAAYELLDEEGLEGLTIRAVLARTGLARRAFYESFSGKDDLVLAVFEQTIRLAASYYRTEAARLTRPLERLRLIVTSIGLGTSSIADVAGADAAGPPHRRNAALAREHLRLADTRPRELQMALAPLLALMAEQLREGVAQGEVRGCEPDLTANLIYNLVSTTMHAELLAEETGNRDPGRRLRLATELWEFCRRAVAA